MSTQVVRHTSRGVDITLNFASTENNLSWSFTQEGDGEIYDVSFTNVASYTIAGGAVTLPYGVINGSYYAVSIVKTTTGQTASITFKTRRATNKNNLVSVPDFGQYDGRYVFISSRTNLFKLDSELLKSTNYAGAGAWTQNPIINTYTFPDISNEPNNVGTLNTLFWRSICFIVVSSEPVLFCYGSNDTTNDEVCCLFKISDGKFYKLDFSAEGYTRTSTGSGALNVCGAISYDYINNYVVIRRTRGAGAALFYFDQNFNRIALAKTADRIFHGGETGQGGTIRKHNIDHITGEFCTHLSRVLISNEKNRNYLDYANADAKYIRSTGNVITCNRNIITQRRLYDSNGWLVASFGSTETITGSAGAICVSESKNWIFGCSSSNVGVWRNSISNLTDGFNYNMTIGTVDHNGFRGCINSDYSGLAFAWGLTTKESGRRLYVFDPTKLDASFEVGYLDFVNEINDIYTTQFL